MPNTSHATANSKGDTVLTTGTATLRSMQTSLPQGWQKIYH